MMCSGPPRVSRRLAWTTTVGLAVILYFALIPPFIYGDGWEYSYQLESLARHFTPDLRAEDEAAAERYFPWLPSEEPYSYVTAADGRKYGMHFWGYSLSAVPARLLLAATGAHPLAAFQVTNACWALAAAGLVLSGPRAGLGRRAMVFALAGVGPAAWYLVFTGPELFTWAATVTAVVWLDGRRYALAGAAAGLGAMQNPPLVFLAAAAVGLAASERRWRDAARATAGGGLAFVPPAFNLWHFGRPSLIADGFLDPAGVSLARTWGMATDLNQGILPYAPLLLPAAIGGAVALLSRLDRRAMAVVLAVILMAVGSQLQVNWNSGSLGLMRYCVWLLPPLAWLATTWLWPYCAGRAVLLAAVGVQATVMVCCLPPDDGYLFQSPAARLVLTHAPEWYDPEPEVFIERILHLDPAPPDSLPVGFVLSNGNITKLLVGAAQLDRVTTQYTIDPEYLPVLRQAVEAAGGRPVYVHPPAGAVTGVYRPDPPHPTGR